MSLLPSASACCDPCSDSSTVEVSIADLIDAALQDSGIALNIVAFGAVPDDEDAAAANVVAINAALVQGQTDCLPVYVPAGDFKINTQLTGLSNVTFFGGGQCSKITQLSTSATNANVMMFDSKTNFEVYGIHFVASGAFTTSAAIDASFSGLALRDSTNFRIHDCFFSAAAYNGIIANRCDYFYIYKNQFPAPGTADPYVIQKQTNDIEIVDSTWFEISDNDCVSTTSTVCDIGISIYGGIQEAGGGAARNTTNFVVRNNRIKNKTEYAINLYIFVPDGVSDYLVEGNIIDNVDGSYHHVAEGLLYSGITNGTAAGDGIYLQGPSRGVTRGNIVTNCGLYTRAHGSHVKGAIGAGGNPDVIISGDNYCENNYYAGINVNNSGAFGDQASRIPDISNNHVHGVGYVVPVSATNGSPVITLDAAYRIAPLSPYEAYRAFGGFYIGDVVDITLAGVAGANITAATIIAIDPANGTVTIDTNASTTTSLAKICLSESSATAPSIRGGIIIAAIHRPLVHGNTVSQKTENFFVTPGGLARFRGVEILGDAVDLMLYPRITDNTVKGFYSGITLQSSLDGDINGNTCINFTTFGITANSTVTRTSIRGNRLVSGLTGILVNSLGGDVAGNYMGSVVNGIDSTGTERIHEDNRISPATTAFNNQTPIRAFTAADTTPSVNGAVSWTCAYTNAITMLDDGITGDIVTVYSLGSTANYTHSANFVLRGAVNAAIAAGESITFQRTSATAWREIGRNQ